MALSLFGCLVLKFAKESEFEAVFASEMTLSTSSCIAKLMPAEVLRSWVRELSPVWQSREVRDPAALLLGQAAPNTAAPGLHAIVSPFSV